MATSKSHSRISNTWIRDDLSKLSIYAQGCYIHLLSFANGDPNKPVYPSQDTLSDRLHISRNSVVKGLKELESAGIIRRESQAKNARSRYGTNRYYVLKTV